MLFRNTYYNNRALQLWKAKNDHLKLDITTDFLLFKIENIYNVH